MCIRKLLIGQIMTDGIRMICQNWWSTMMNQMTVVIFKKLRGIMWPSGSSKRKISCILNTRRIKGIILNVLN